MLHDLQQQFPLVGWLIGLLGGIVGLVAGGLATYKNLAEIWAGRRRRSQEARFRRIERDLLASLAQIPSGHGLQLGGTDLGEDLNDFVRWLRTRGQVAVRPDGDGRFFIRMLNFADGLVDNEQLTLGAG